MSDTYYAVKSMTYEFSLHCESATETHKSLIIPASPLTIRSIIQTSVELQFESFVSVLPISSPGLNVAKASNFIRWKADQLLQSLGQPKFYEVDNPITTLETYWYKPAYS